MSGGLISSLNRRKTKKREVTTPSGFFNQNTNLNVINNYILNNIKDKESLENYKKDVKDILQFWKGLCMKKETSNSFNADKLSAVRNFIQIATNYIKLDLISEPITDNLCPECKNELILEDDSKYCTNCDIYQNNNLTHITFSETPRTNNSNGEHNNKKIFIEAVKNYQGKIFVEFPSDIYEKVEEYCVKNRMNKYNLTRPKTEIIFKKLKYKDYYKYINLFLYNFIGKELHDIGEYEELLYKDYDLFYYYYPELKGDDNRSSINANYLVDKFMNRRGIVHNKDDLSIPKTENTQDKNNYITGKVFRRLGWKFN